MEKVYVLTGNEMDTLLSRVANMERMLTSLMAITKKETALPERDVRPKDIALYLGISVENIYSYGRFWLPRFGEGK
jgi:hypothetical protein